MPIQALSQFFHTACTLFRSHVYKEPRNSCTCAGSRGCTSGQRKNNLSYQQGHKQEQVFHFLSVFPCQHYLLFFYFSCKKSLLFCQTASLLPTLALFFRLRPLQ